MHPLLFELVTFPLRKRSKDRLVDLKAVEHFTDIVSSNTYTMDEVGHFSFFEDPIELSRLISEIV